MECSIKQGVVLQVKECGKREEIVVDIDGKAEKGINYPTLTGSCQAGDRVVLNTTAVDLALGTGGWHFVTAVVGATRSLSGPGHIMKLRYTPHQGKVLSVEEPDSKFHDIFKTADDLGGMPVVIGTLHSMLAPFCLGFAHFCQGKKVVYVMSDGAALPLGLSRLVQSLRLKGMLSATITFGNAFGGDFEAVNIYSALLAAKFVCGADVAIILMGPGVVGTGTTWGNTALEQGVFIDAVNTLNGHPIAIPRLSFADKRQRHQGISHHTITALTRVAKTACSIAIPQTLETNQIISEQARLFLNHHIYWEDTEKHHSILVDAPIELNSMGRTLNEDMMFFHAPLAASLTASRFLLPDTIDQG